MLTQTIKYVFCTAGEVLESILKFYSCSNKTE